MAKGYDISEFQGNVSWPNVAADFIFIRTFSGYRNDLKYQEYWIGAKSRQIPRGAYGYFVGDRDALSQAQATLAPIAGDYGELGVMCDMEDARTWQPLTQEQRVQAALTYMKYCEDTTGHKSFFYTYPSFMSSLMGNDQRLHDYYLDWSNLGNSVVPPWTLIVKQYTINSGEPGFPGQVDLDYIDNDVLRQILGGDIMSAETEAFVKDLHDYMNEQKQGKWIVAPKNGVNASSDIVALIQTAIKNSTAAVIAAVNAKVSDSSSTLDVNTFATNLANVLGPELAKEIGNALVKGSS